jgi:hypothetical protein
MSGRVYNVGGQVEEWSNRDDILKAFNKMKDKGNWAGIQHILTARFTHYDESFKDPFFFPNPSFRAYIANNDENVPDTEVDCVLIPTGHTHLSRIGGDLAKILVKVRGRVHTTLLLSNESATSDFLAHFLFPALAHGVTDESQIHSNWDDTCPWSYYYNTYSR